MKKLVAFCFLLTGVIFVSKAQELGIRVGDVTGGDVAIDGVFSTGEFNRIHGDVSFGGGGVGVDMLWDFLYRPISEGLDEGYLNWYVGAGPSVYLNDPFFFSAMSEIGAEYRFEDFPVSLSVDWRPTLTIVETTDLYFGFFGFNARYVFKGK